MPTRNRVIYQSQAVYAGPDKDTSTKLFIQETGGNAPSQLQRVQSANYSFDVARQDVNQYGDLAAIDRVILESPTVSLDLSWYLCSFYNEDKLGFKINDSSVSHSNLISCLADVLTAGGDERNYYVRITPEGTDAAGLAETDSAGTSRVIGVGNGFMSSYSSEGSVGAFPTSSLTVEALNMSVSNGITGFSPYVAATDGAKNATHQFILPVATSRTGVNIVTALKPGEVTLEVPTLMGAGTVEAKIQSYNLSFDLAREPLAKLGSRFAFAREITFPVTVSLSVDLLVGDLTTGNLSDLITTDSSHNLNILFKTGVVPANHIAFALKGAKLDSQSFTSSLGDNETATLTFSSQIGSSSQTTVGLFMSGSHLT